MLNWIRVLGQRIHGLLSRRRLDEEFQQELDTHLEMLTEENLRRGLSPEEARRMARVQLGGITQLRETHHEMWSLPWLETLWQDLPYGLRQLRRNPGFTAVAVVTLALGIGANTAIFSVVNAVLLRPLPYHDPSTLVEVHTLNPSRGTTEGSFSPQDLRDFRSQANSFESISGYWYSPSMSLYTLLGEGEPTLIETASVDSNFLITLGVAPALGRGFIPKENIAGKDNVVILSDSLWRERFSGDPSIIGKPIRIGGGELVVVGVMGPEFRFPSAHVGFWVPLSRVTDGDIPHRRGIRWINVLARLRPGVKPEQAASESTLILKRLAWQYPDTNEGWDKGVVESLRATIVGQVKPILLVLLAAVGLVLLTACANLANLTLARGAARRREFAVRSAMGAGWSRLFRHSVIESVLLAAFGGAAAFAITPWISSGLVALAGSAIPRSTEIHMDWTVVLFGAALTLLTGLAIGAVPAFKLANTDVARALKASGARASADPARQRGREALVIAEVSLACLLLAASGLVLKSLWKLVTTDPGFEARHVLTVQLVIPVYKYHNGQLIESYRDELIRRVGAIPGVEAVGAGKTVPLAGGGEPYQFKIMNTARGTIDVVPRGGVYIVTPGYFKTLRIPIVAGRVFDERDFQEHKQVTLINQGFAREYWPGENPVGKYLYITSTARVEVVGVVGDVHNEGLSTRPLPAIYAPMNLMSRTKFDLFIRTSADPLALAGSVRRTIHQIEPEQPIQEMAPLEQVVHDDAAEPRFFAIIMAFFGAMALLLAATGVFAVLSYSVRQRTHEIGIRMALGAEKRDVLWMVVGQGLKLALIGVAIGIAGALALTRFLSSLLYGVKPTDPLTFIAVSLILIAVALLACYIPARRAAKVDPMVALRYE
jgi:predicted permease